ncbi:MAG: hypothetical protein AAF587_34200 [Bacteroidota bacterium]
MSVSTSIYKIILLGIGLLSLPNLLIGQSEHPEQNRDVSTYVESDTTEQVSHPILSIEPIEITAGILIVIESPICEYPLLSSRKSIEHLLPRKIPSYDQLEEWFWMTHSEVFCDSF